METTFYFESALKDDINGSPKKVFVRLFEPKGKPKAIIQISHGMLESSSAYIEFAKYLAFNGFAVAINDHLGHGKTVGENDVKGYFGEKDGYKNLVFDMRTLTSELVKKYPNLPIFLIAHSMGTMLTRKYLEVYSGNLVIKGCLFLGVASANPLSWLGLLTAKIEKMIYGSTKESKITGFLLRDEFDRKFHKKLSLKPHVKFHPYAWLTSDENMQELLYSYNDSSNTFTNSGFIDLFKMMLDSNSKRLFNAIPKDLPIALFSGDHDPVGGYGKGVQVVYDKLVDSGCTCVFMKIYENKRHGLLYEVNKTEVISDIISWVNDKI